MSENLSDELDPDAALALAARVEDAQLAAGAVRYGRVGTVGCARVVVNAQSPLPSSNFAVGLDSTSAGVGHTLLALEQTFADAGRAEALVHASPTTVPEIEGLADDAGWFAVTESVAVVTFVASRAPTDGIRPARSAELPAVAELIADAVELPEAGVGELVRLLGHRLDDARSVVLVSDDGAAVAYAGDTVGVVEHVVVRPSRRRRGAGTALLAAAGQRLFDLGVSVVGGVAEEAGAAEHLATACDYLAAYPVTTYARRLDELL